MKQNKVKEYFKKLGIGTIIFFTIKGLITTTLIIFGMVGLTSC